jgi:hypothetical protein
VLFAYANCLFQIDTNYQKYNPIQSINDFNGIKISSENRESIYKFLGKYNLSPEIISDRIHRKNYHQAKTRRWFGIDRKNGGADINNTPEGILFWQTIDAQNARKNWKWNYRGGNLEGALRDLVVKMMYKRYNNFRRRGKRS